MRGHLEVGQGGVCTLCIAPAPGAVGLLAAGSNDDVGFEVVHGAVCSGRVHGLGQGSHRGGVRQVGQEQLAGGATGEYLGRLQGILQRRYRTERHGVALRALPIARQF